MNTVSNKSYPQSVHPMRGSRGGGGGGQGVLTPLENHEAKGSLRKRAVTGPDPLEQWKIKPAFNVW